MSRHVTTLSLDDRESHQGPTGKLVAHLGNTFEKMGVEGKRHHQGASRPVDGPLLVEEGAGHGIGGAGGH